MCCLIYVYIYVSKMKYLWSFHTRLWFGVQSVVDCYAMCLLFHFVDEM